ncbi:MAG TPA: ABC transporter ATP-binding protein [Solirubrobacterales bacterium]
MEAALAVRGVAKRYGRTEALRGIDLEVAPGEMVGLLGPNGAGKSTLTKIACGLVRATDGTARVLGHVAGSPQARRQTGYLAELFRFPSWASAEELLTLHQRLAGSGGGAVERGELLELVGLGDAGGKRIGAMSKGMQQRLGLAQALIGSPRLLLLDEPTSALDPAGRRTVRQVLVGLRERGVSALINSHLLTEVERTCDRVTILSEGSVVAEGSPSQLAGGRGVEVVTERGARRFEDASRDEIPGIVSDLIAAGERIYEVRPLGSTLEDAYLNVVGEQGQ